MATTPMRFNPYHTEFRYNPTLRAAMVRGPRLPRALRERTGKVLNRPFGSTIPKETVEDHIQKRRTGQNQGPPNYLEMPGRDPRRRDMHN